MSDGGGGGGGGGAKQGRRSAAVWHAGSALAGRGAAPAGVRPHSALPAAALCTLQAPDFPAPARRASRSHGTFLQLSHPLPVLCSRQPHSGAQRLHLHLQLSTQRGAGADRRAQVRPEGGPPLAEGHAPARHSPACSAHALMHPTCTILRPLPAATPHLVAAGILSWTASSACCAPTWTR